MPIARFSFAPSNQLAGRPHVVVDGPATVGTTLCLSHWPGSPELPSGLADDLSAQIAFRYLDHPVDLHAPAELVTNNHYDQDGLVGVFTLLDPESALGHRDLLNDLAAAGDFGTYRHRAAARASMTVSAFTDPERSPYGPLPGAYDEMTALLYAETLPRVVELVEHPERWRDLWADEDAALTASETALADGSIEIVEHPDVELAVVTVHAGGSGVGGGHRFGGRRFGDVHPMALHNATERVVLLLVLPDGRYRVTHRYETWVTVRSRRLPPRPDLAPLAVALTEFDDVTWQADPIQDMTPSLQPVDGAGSSLAPATVVDVVLHHLRTAPPAFDTFRGGLLTPSASG